MDQEKALVAFEKHAIRRFFDETEEIWYFSVVDVVAALTDSANPRDYWFKMKIRVETEDGFELSTICRQLKLKALDGKMRETDCASTEGLLRIIQSIPSPTDNETARNHLRKSAPSADTFFPPRAESCPAIFA